MSDESKKIHNLAVKTAVQGYLDFWRSAEHIELDEDDKCVVDHTITKINELKLGD